MVARAMCLFKSIQLEHPLVNILVQHVAILYIWHIQRYCRLFEFLEEVAARLLSFVAIVDRKVQPTKHVDLRGRIHDAACRPFLSLSVN